MTPNDKKTLWDHLEAMTDEEHVAFIKKVYAPMTDEERAAEAEDAGFDLSDFDDLNNEENAS